MLALVVHVVLATPLSTTQALNLLEVPANAPVFATAKYKQLGACQHHVDVILRGTPRDLALGAVAKDTPLRIGCVSPRYAKAGAAIDANVMRCSTDGEECQAWLAHARAVVLDAVADDDSDAVSFARLLSAMTGIGFKDAIDPAACARALRGAARLSAAHPDDGYIQRIALAAWMILPATDADSDFTALLKRALQTSPDDPDILSAMVVISEHANATDTAAIIIDNAVNSASTPTARAYALYLSGCIALQKKDTVAAHDYFTTAAKNDPFDGRYSKAIKETSPESRAEPRCNLVFSPFSQALKTALATKR